MNKQRGMSKYLMRCTLLFYVVVFCCASLTFAEKTDVVTLRNGVAVIGEIKGMDRGKLTYSTDDMGTVFVDWTKVRRLASKATFDIVVKSGRRYLGSLQESGEDGKVLIVTETERITEDIQSVVRITPLKVRFWKRFKGAISLGFDFQKAKKQQTLTTRTKISYNGPKWELRLEGDGYINTRDDAEKISRNSVILSYERFLPKLWSYLGFAKLQQNDELSLDLRAYLGGGGGRFFVKNNFLQFGGIAVLTLTAEKYAGAEGYQQNLEAGFLFNFQAFRYHSPDLDLTADLRVFPNLTDWGRVRIEFRTSVDYEIFNDFYLTLSFYNHFDSRPPSDAGASKNDYRMDIGITWKFN